jgi:hypothetical protein
MFRNCLVGKVQACRPIYPDSAAAKRKRLCNSERDHSEAWDSLEVFYVERGDIEAKMEGRGSDEQVWEVDADALAHLFAVDASGQARHLQH